VSGCRGRSIHSPCAWIATAAFALAACAGPAPRQTLGLRVSNELGRPIAELRKKPCGDIELAFTTIDASRIEPGAVREIQLPRSCIDIVAFDERGRIVGEQRNLKMMPGSSWVLRR